MKRAFFPASACCLLSFAAPAFAQEAQVTVTGPTPAPAVAAPAAPPAAAVVVAPAPSAKVEEKKDEKKKEEEPKDSAHFRFGMGLDGSFLYAAGQDGIEGAAAGLQLRLGAQINQWFAIYYQPHAIIGGTISQGPSVGAGLPGLPKATLIGAVFNSGLIEATLPVLHIGAGPSADILGIQGYAVQGETGGSTNVYFGVDGRVAIVIGGHGPGSHVGFEIEGNVHPTFWEGTVLTTFSVGIGGELY
jgi:hypothetical protein